MEELYQKTKTIINKYQIKANKALGQNFLINEEVILKIIQKANASEEDLIIEIGPGLGTLTEYLLQKARKVVCIELDKKMIPILEDRFLKEKNFSLINEDVLKVDLKEMIIEEKKKDPSIKNVKIVANLPYYITTPIIMKLLEEKLELDSITVMVQNEVAKRLAEIPGGKETGAITYSVYYYANCEKIVFVPKDSFIPSPEVDSQVIHFTLRKKPIVEVKNEALFFKVIKVAFMQRRKTLINGLVNGNIIKDKEKATQILRTIGIDEKARAETLSIEQFAILVDEINNTEKI